ncbi:MAG: phosphomethylpyrimidine synthase ThiC [Marinilabiliales bacterium]|nr:phosphomethylpyrimidine synthase ThiC [Marinilabiliales bacterium]
MAFAAEREGGERRSSAARAGGGRARDRARPTCGTCEPGAGARSARVLLCKINANIGNSSAVSDVGRRGGEAPSWRCGWGADAVMDLSTGGDIDASARGGSCATRRCRSGPVPIYQTLDERCKPRPRGAGHRVTSSTRGGAGTRRRRRLRDGARRAAAAGTCRWSRSRVTGIVSPRRSDHGAVDA